MTEQPLVTAIVATYNRAHVVGRAIESILAQTYAHIEVIVVDDGSADDTVGLLSRFGSRLRILRQANAGPGAARNRGIENARGEIIAFLDSDDLWLPEKIDRQVALLRNAGESVPCCLCNATIVAGDRAVITTFENARLRPAQEEGLWLNPMEVLADRFVLFNQAVAIRRSALARTGGFDQNLRYLEDYDLAMRLAMLGPFAYTSKPLVTYFQGTDGSLANEALGKILRLREHEVMVRTRALEMAQAAGKKQLVPKTRKALARAQRNLWFARISHAGKLGAAPAAGAYYRLMRLRDAIHRRSPGFETMKTTPLAASSATVQATEYAVQGGAGGG